MKGSLIILLFIVVSCNQEKPVNEISGFDKSETEVLDKVINNDSIVLTNFFNDTAYNEYLDNIFNIECIDTIPLTNLTELPSEVGQLLYEPYENEFESRKFFILTKKQFHNGSNVLILLRNEMLLTGKSVELHKFNASMKYLDIAQIAYKWGDGGQGFICDSELINDSTITFSSFYSEWDEMDAEMIEKMRGKLHLNSADTIVESLIETTYNSQKAKEFFKR